MNGIIQKTVNGKMSTPSFRKNLQYAVSFGIMILDDFI